jgi:sarcosine oxidase subunit beta
VNPVPYVDGPPKTAEIVVIGGGLVGAATAFFARGAGLDPVIVERRPALCTLTTPASTGAFRLQFDNFEELEMVRESVELFLNFRDVTEQDDYDLSIRQQGYLWVTTDERRAERSKRLVELQHSWGQTDVEFLTADRLRTEFPYVTPEAVGARWRSDDGFLDPKTLTMGLVAASRARIVTSCEVTGFVEKDGRLLGVATAKGTIATGTAVVAAGPFSGIVSRSAGVDLPIETVARQKVVIPEAPDVPAWAPMTIDDDAGAHWRPALSSGAFLLFTDPATEPTPPVEDVPPDHEHVFGILDPSSPHSIARIAPFWAKVWERNEVTWLVQTGQYTMTPDHRPLIGATSLEGLFLNSGYSGHGIMGGPAGSRRLVDLVTGRTHESDNPFRLDRTFEERELDLL